MEFKSVAVYSLIATLVVLMIYIALPFIPSILVGSVLASATYPVYSKLHSKRIHSRLLSFIFVSLFTALFLIPISLVVVIGAKQTIGFFENSTSFVSEVKALEKSTLFDNESLDVFEIIDASSLIENILTLFSSSLVKLFQNFIQSIPLASLSVCIAIITMYFCLSDSKSLKGTLFKNTLFSKSENEKIITSFNKSCHIVIVSNVAGASIQGAIAFITAMATGVGNAFLIGFGTFMLSFIPIFGTAPITLSLAAHSFYFNSLGIGFVWLIVGFLIGASDNLIKAWWLQENSRLHPFLALLAVIGGVIALGIPGIILGPLLVTFFISTTPLLIEAATKNS